MKTTSLRNILYNIKILYLFILILRILYIFLAYIVMQQNEKLPPARNKLYEIEDN